MDTSKPDIAALRTEIEVLRTEIARIGHRSNNRIDDLSLVIAGGLMLIIAAMLVGLAIGRAT